MTPSQPLDEADAMVKVRAARGAKQ